MADENFDATESGASDTFPQQCSALRKNGFVMIKGRPCKIVEMSTSKTGKHGHAKVHMVALDIFTQKKYEDICPSTHNMNVPHVSRKDYMLTDIQDDGYLELFDEAKPENNKCNLKLPEGELGDEIRKSFDDGDTVLVTVLNAIKEEKVIAHKISKD